MKHKKVLETTKKIDNKVQNDQTAGLSKKCCINKLMTYKTGTTCPDLRFIKNILS